MLIQKFSHFLPIFLLIVSDYKCVNGQRVLWLLTWPKATSTSPYSSYPQGHNYYGTVAHPYSSVRSIDSGSRFIFGDFFTKNRIHDQSHSGPFYQRSTPNVLPSPPQIQHLLMKEDGSASDMIWHEHDSKRRNKVKEIEIEPVFFENDNIFMQEDQVVRKEDDEDRDNAGTSTNSNIIIGNGSGSAEYSLMRHPLPFHEDDDKLTTTKVNINMRCIQPHLEGNQARYDPVTGSCYTVGTRGPCGKLMIFMAVPGDNFNGICSCDYDSFDRPLVPVGGQCHFLYTQAMCHPGYWLTSVTPTLEPVCELNPCYNSHQNSKIRSISQSQSSSIPLVFFKGECISLNSPSRHCRRDGEVVLFPKGSAKPQCGFHPNSTKRIQRRQISNIRLFRCRPGERRNRITKKCARQTKTYFV